MDVLTQGLDIANQKPALSAGVSADYLKYRSQNNTYSPGSTISVTIPTGQSSQWLLSSESFLEFEFLPTCSVLTENAQIRLDNSIYSAFQSIRIWHGSTLLHSQNYANRTLNALLDFSANDRRAAAISVGCDYESPYDGALLFRGVALNGAPTPFGPRKFCVPLAGIPILGTGSDSAIPLGLLSAADLRLEIELAPATQVMTTVYSGVDYDETSKSTSNGVGSVLGYTIQDVHYNAKVSTLSPDVNARLLSSFAQRPLMIPSTAWACETGNLEAAATAFNMKLNMQYSSLRAIYWYAVSQNVANGVATTANNYPRAVSSRFAGGPLQSVWLSIGGKSVPSDRNSTIAGTPPVYITEACDFHGSVAFSSLMRCFNASTSVDIPANVHPAMYNSSVMTAAKQTAAHGQFLYGFDLERAEGSTDQVYQGINTQSTPIDLHLTYGSRAGSAAHSVFAMANYDVTFVLEDGNLRPAL